MVSRIALALAAVGALSMVGPHSASAGGIPGVGHANCTLLGAAKIKPALISGGMATPVNTKFKGALTCSGGTGDGASIATGKVKGLITSSGTNDCASLGTMGLPAFDLAVKWKGSTKLLASTVHFAATPPGAINLAGPGGSIQITLSGTMDAMGSFAGNTVTVVADTDELATAFVTACTPPSKGLKIFHFTGVNGASSFDF